LREEVVARDNLKAALARVRQKQGSPGSDGMTPEELLPYLREHWPRLREELLAGTYQPQPVKRGESPKKGGGVRQLGIPTVLDRFLQQALLQVLPPRRDPTCSEHSYGVRPGRSAQQAIAEAQAYVEEGRRSVVDVDLEQGFDRGNHDVLRGRLAKRIEDKRLLRLSRRYLEAGIMAHGVGSERHEGTRHGGPLSPLLANVLLDEVDKELEKRGHAFVRFADDCNVYGRAPKAGERVLTVLRKQDAPRHLRSNEARSTVARGLTRQFLGIAFWRGPGGKLHRRVADPALEGLKDRVRALTGRSRGRSVPQVVEELRPYLRGWYAYFRLAETPVVFRRLAEWIRHRLRQLYLKQWGRGPTIYPKLRALGASERLARSVAFGAQRWWHHASRSINQVLTNAHFDRLGLPRLAR
jgi:group II intron reverse transcriptase/maturase